MRLAGTKLAANHQYRGFGDQLYDLSGERPSLDLNFSSTKSLVDAITGQNLVTFTRASSGTYVDSQGVIRTATTNLLLRSEEFDSASWVKRTNGTASTPVVTHNFGLAPNGSTTASRLQANRGVGNTASDQSSIDQTVSGLSDPHTITISIWAKSNTGLAQTVYFRNATGDGGTQIIVTADWQRFSLTGSRTGDTTNSLQIGSRGGANATNSVDILIWGAQLEQSSTVGEYIPTTSTINSAPRFDHNPTTGESLGLLVEEQRTNSIRNNTMVGAVAGTPGTLPTNWTESLAGLTREVVGIGTQNGVSYIDIRLSGRSTGTQAIFRWDGGITAAEGQSWAHSAWIARVSGSLPSGNIALSANLFNASSVYVGDTNAIQIKSLISDSFGRVSGVNTISTATTATARPYIYFLMANGESVDFTLRIGMPQFEQGAFATSVIPTTTAAATRSADVASITGTNFSSWYRQDEGSLFTDCTINYTVPGTSFPLVASLNDGTSNNKIENGFLTASSASFEIITGGATQAAMYPNASNALTRRLATGFRINDFAASINGGAINTDTSGTIPTVDRLRIGDRTGSGGNTLSLFGTIRRLTYWPRRLPNETLQRITQ